MKILLINDNPVVNKLVTLSAQKTSDDLEVVSSVDAIASTHYNLVVIDDALYSDAMLTALNEKISFDKSLYICSRDAEEVGGFSEVLKKPFLPTDLVEIFIKIGDSASDLDTQDDFTLLDEEIEPKIEDSFTSNKEDDLDDEILNLEKLDDLDDFKLDDLNEDEISLDDGMDDTLGESVLDDEEAQKVKDLLDETEDTDEEILNSDDLDLGDEDLELEDFDMEDDLELESSTPLEENLDDLDLSISEREDETLEDNPDVENIKNASEEELHDDLDLESQIESSVDENEDVNEESADDLESETESTEGELELEDTNETLEDDLESQINSAVDELSDEELESEVDEETLLDIVSGDLDSLTSRDLKLAVGEVVDSEPVQEEIQVADIADADALVAEDESTENVETENVEGVEALKTLLSALTDKKVVASMKGMKISINITLGD